MKIVNLDTADVLDIPVGGEWPEGRWAELERLVPWQACALVPVLVLRLQENERAIRSISDWGRRLVKDVEKQFRRVARNRA